MAGYKTAVLKGLDTATLNSAGILQGVPTTKTFSSKSCDGMSGLHTCNFYWPWRATWMKMTRTSTRSWTSSLAVQSDIRSDKNDGISCEIGIRYPTLQSIMSGHKKILSIKVSNCSESIACNKTCYITWYILAVAGCIHLCRETVISNSLRSSSYNQSLRVIGHKSVEGWEPFGSTSCRSWTSAVWKRCSTRVGHLPLATSITQLTPFSTPHSSLAAFETCWVDCWQLGDWAIDSC